MSISDIYEVLKPILIHAGEIAVFLAVVSRGINILVRAFEGKDLRL